MIIEKDTDPGFKSLQSLVNYIDGHIVKVGALGEEGYDRTVTNKVLRTKRKKGKIDNVSLAAIHEFGARGAGRDKNVNIPARPFLAPTFDKNQSKYDKMIKKAIDQGIDAKSQTVFQRQFGQVGVEMQNDVRSQITNGSYIPNKASTIKKKGSTKPLIDSGELRNAILFDFGKNI